MDAKTTRAIKLLALLFLVLAGSARAQNVPYSNIAISAAGRPIAGAGISVCNSPGLATTAASVSSNLVTLTMSSNPVTAGFAANMTLQVSGFTGGDTYLNGGVLSSGAVITGGFTILAVTPTTIIYQLSHANASATTNGFAFQQGNISTSCAPLASITSDQAGVSPITQPGLVSNNLGNYSFFASAGPYVLQYNGSGVAVQLQPIAVPVSTANNNNFTGANFFSQLAPGPVSTIANSPSGATQSGNTVTITTTAGCNFVTNEPVVVAGVGVTGYNGTYTVLSPGCNGGSSFTYATLLTGLAASGGGQVAGGTLATAPVNTVNLNNACVGDGSTPASLQACINKYPNGSGDIFAPAGIYSSTSCPVLTIGGTAPNVQDGLRFQGAGNSTVIQYTGPPGCAQVILVQNSTPATLLLFGLLFRDFVVRSNGNAAVGIKFNEVHSTTVQDVRVRDVNLTGFQWYGGVGNVLNHIMVTQNDGYLPQPFSTVPVHCFDFGTSAGAAGDGITSSHFIAPRCEYESGIGFLAADWQFNTVSGGQLSFNAGAALDLENGPGPGSTANTFDSTLYETPTGTQFTIANSPTGATESGNTITITTTAVCSFTTGQIVQLNNVGSGFYNGNYTVLTPSCNGGSSFTATAPISGLPASGGGTATLGIEAVTLNASGNAFTGSWVGGSPNVSGLGAYFHIKASGTNNVIDSGLIQSMIIDSGALNNKTRNIIMDPALFTDNGSNTQVENNFNPNNHKQWFFLRPTWRQVLPGPQAADGLIGGAGYDPLDSPVQSCWDFSTVPRVISSTPLTPSSPWRALLFSYWQNNTDGGGLNQLPPILEVTSANNTVPVGTVTVTFSVTTNPITGKGQLQAVTAANNASFCGSVFMFPNPNGSAGTASISVKGNIVTPGSISAGSATGAFISTAAPTSVDFVSTNGSAYRNNSAGGSYFFDLGNVTTRDGNASPGGSWKFTGTIAAGGSTPTLTGTGACATFGAKVGGAFAGSSSCASATAASTLTITFAITQTNGYHCRVDDETNRANLFQQTGHTTTSCTLTATSVTQNDVFVFSGIGF